MAENHSAGQIRDLKASPLDLNIHRPEEPAGELENQNLWSRSLARKWTVTLFLGTCLLYCARMTTPVCAVSMAADFHWSKIDSGLVLGGFFWGYCFTQILGGHASDKVGGERVLFISAASWALITAGTPVLAHLGPHTLALMTVARVLMGLLQGVFFPSLASLCSQRVVEAERGFLMSTMHSGSHLGTLLAGGMGSVMLDRYGWESMFYCTGLLAGLWAVTVKYYLLRDDIAVNQMEKRSEIQPSLSRKRWLHLFKKPPVWAMVFAHMCICSTSYTLLSWLPMFFKESFPHATPWVYNVVPWLMAIPSGLCGGFVSDFLITKGYSVASVRKIMQFGAMGLSSMFILPLSGSVSFTSAVVFISAAVGFTTFTAGGVSVNVQDLTPSCAGALYGFMNMMGALMGLVLVSFSGYLIEVTLSWSVVFSLVTLVNVTGLGVFLVFGDAQRVDRQEDGQLIVV
ncbi:solute carrier family 17 member 9-like isoform X1 [Poecilia formosa]|uniref:Voltage-gated purine nucleotide uniporter SLC17A9 n=2 Tax=Poecilia formosa TaxID=48698 RepID=A0A087XIJ5_POEFO|nr:PREDICTED: solute carrier family 17 member 9-like isoform X1 [Poecilia formosa]